MKGGKTVSKWICSICGYVYDEEKEGVPFDRLPDTWKCPLCGADKAAFAPEGESAPKPAPAAPVRMEGDMRELSAGELAAVCSNLARGCEKQYKEEEAALFRQLADYFTAAAPAVPQPDVSRLADMIQADLQEGHPAVRSAAQACGDRGTLRVCTWGEKVTNMLSSLLQQYQEEGEAFLQGTSIWVCTVCGFVYVGDRPPELCPVCKVPTWKFEDIKGRALA